MSAPKPLTKGEKRKAEVLRVARAHLIAKGYDAFSMREVATELGTKIGHIQYYFPSRTDLFEALIREEFEDDLESIEEIKRTTKLPKAALEKVTKMLLRNWTTDGARIYALMSFLAMHDAKFGKIKSQIYKQFHTIIEDLICEVRGCEASQETRTDARLVTAVMDGALLQQTPDNPLTNAIIANVLNIAVGET
ncbi:MAG: TetR/AcrR family transcriptional regulator [Pseudomonadota bacterium]